MESRRVSLRPNGTTPPTGSSPETSTPNLVEEPAISGSQCEPFRKIILAKCELGLSAKRIHQDLVADYEFDGKYWSVHPFVKTLGAHRELPFRRMEVEPGEERQVDFGTGAKITPVRSSRRECEHQGTKGRLNAASQNEHLCHWERTVADTRIHGTPCKQVRSDFETNERASLSKLPVQRFAFYHEAKRKVSRDGHTSINRTFYSVPPEYLGHDAWVRHDSHLVRIFDQCHRHIATHVVIERGRFQTAPKHIASEKISPIERGIGHLHWKMRLIGPSSARWADAVVEGRGVEASRVLQGVLGMSRKHSADDIEKACHAAWQSDAINCRIIRTLLK